MPRRTHWVVFALLLGSLGCSDEAPPTGGKAVGDPCAAASECAGALGCVEGACGCEAPEVACGDVCCADGQACEDGQCVVACAADATRCGARCCGAGEVCEEGICVSACAVECGAACCAEGEVCFMGTTCCREDLQCGDVCCDDGQLCDLGVCNVDCGGGVPGCGIEQACCGAGEICHQGQCVTPGDPCTPYVACATREERRPCPEGQICDPELRACVPQAIDPDCVYMPPAGVFDPVPLFTWGQRRQRTCTTAAECQRAEVCTDGFCAVTWPHVAPGPDDMPDHYQSTSIPMVADLDGDCVPEIIFNTFAQSNFTGNGVLRAIRGDDGSKVWTVTDEAYRTDGTANPAVGDVDGDGTPEVFVTGPGKNVLRVAADGAPVWVSEPFTGPEGSGSITLANLDGDRHAEIIIGAAVFDSAGQLAWEGGLGRGIAGQGPISCVADLDGDDRPELIAGKTVYEFTGTVAGGDFAGAMRVESNTADGYCGIADMDGAPGPEVVLVTGGRIYVLQGQTMATLAELAIPGGGNGGAPNIADFDGDGRPDVGTAGANNYVVARFTAEQDLELIWSAPTEDDSSSRTGSSVFDFDGDGRAEVVYNDEEYVRIYPGVEPACLETPVGAACDGVMTDDEVLFRDLSSSRTRTEYPVVADVDGDFKAEIVFSTSNEASFLDPALTGDAGIEVWADRLDNWVPTRPVWNQHAYHITNSGLRGQLPTVEDDSWSTPAGAPYNSYRRNAQGDRDALCAPDLVVRAVTQDTERCPSLTLRATLVNQGCLAVGAGVRVAFYSMDGTLIGVAETTDAIGPSSATVVELSAPRSGTWQERLQVVVDDDGAGAGALNECEEGNNASDFVDASCRFDL